MLSHWNVQILLFIPSFNSEKCIRRYRVRKKKFIPAENYTLSATPEIYSPRLTRGEKKKEKKTKEGRKKERERENQEGKRKKTRKILENLIEALRY